MSRARARAILLDVMAGLVSAVVGLCYALSFATLVFSGPLAPHLSLGVAMSLTSAAITIPLVALLGPSPFAVAGPDSRSTAVQAGIAATLASVFGTASAEVVRANVFAGLTLTTASTGLALLLFGRWRLGRWIRFVPYPVLGGFLASTGLVLVLGGWRVATGLEPRAAAIVAGFNGVIAAQAAGALLFAALALIVLRRFKHVLALPALLVAGTLACHAIVAISGAGPEHGVMLDLRGMPASLSPWSLVDPARIELSRLLPILGQSAALAVVTALAVLATAAALEVAVREDLDLDRDLVAHGVANLTAGMAGGLVGSNAIARALLARRAGATSPVAGIATGALCLFCLWVDPSLVGVLARPVLGGTLLFLGARLLHEWLVAGRRRLDLADWLLVLLLVLVIAWLGFVAGLALGVVISCGLFAVRYARIPVVHEEISVAARPSSVQRAPEDARLLARHGEDTLVLRLGGHLFFGSAVGLVESIRARLQAAASLRRVVLDFAGVTGMDSSVAVAFARLKQAAEARGVVLVHAGLHDASAARLAREGAGATARYADLDTALREAEEEILARVSPSRPDALQVLAHELGSAELARRFLTLATPVQLAAHDILFRAGDVSSELAWIERGRVDVLVPVSNGAMARVRSIAAHASLGEIGLFLRQPRSASVVAAEATLVHRLGATDLDRLAAADAELALAIHRMLVRGLCERLLASERVAGVR